MMRHAESEERLQGIRDHDRPITDEGRSSAREVTQDTLSYIKSYLYRLQNYSAYTLDARMPAWHAQ